MRWAKKQKKNLRWNEAQQHTHTHIKINKEPVHGHVVQPS